MAGVLNLKERAQGTKGRLLSTSIDLISEQSYSAVSVDDICLKAGVRKGSFYHFFPSKSDLAIAAIEQFWIESRHYLDSIFSPQRPALDRISEYCNFLYDQQAFKFHEAGKVCGCTFSSVGSELSTLDENIRKKSEEIASRFCVYIESALADAEREGILKLKDKNGIARDIHAFICGVMTQAKITNDLKLVKRIKSGVSRLIGYDLK